MITLRILLDENLPEHSVWVQVLVNGAPIVTTTLEKARGLLNA